jgi:hypothetical protein
MTRLERKKEGGGGGRKVWCHFVTLFFWSCSICRPIVLKPDDLASVSLNSGKCFLFILLLFEATLFRVPWDLCWGPHASLSRLLLDCLNGELSGCFCRSRWWVTMSPMGDHVATSLQIGLTLNLRFQKVDRVRGIRDSQEEGNCQHAQKAWWEFWIKFTNWKKEWLCCCWRIQCHRIHHAALVQEDLMLCSFLLWHERSLHNRNRQIWLEV